MLAQLVRDTRAFVAALDVEDLSGAAARDLVGQFAELERLAGAGKLLAAGRLVASGVGPGDDSFRDVDAWLASISGTTIGAARAMTATAARLARQDGVADAVRAGELSLAQADLVSTAVAADPGAEPELLETAGVADVKGLRTECDRVCAAAMARQREADRYERIHQQRSLRHSVTADGSGMITLRGPLDRTAQVMAALEPFEQERFESNRNAGRIEHPEAVAFDAMVHIAEITARDVASRRTRGGRPLATVHVHVSAAAFTRGHTRPGERCEIEGAGPVPVAVAHRLASDAIVAALVVDGTDVTRVVHLGRSVPAAVRTAIVVRDPVCVIAGCEVDRHLEIDHNIPWAQGGPTTLENLGRLCHHHHDLKTRRDLRRLGPPGRQRLVDREEFERHTARTRAA
ncbi:MAG: HNH endonuclease signature motif containing protein [Acidimicrobiia bacterium]